MVGFSFRAVACSAAALATLVIANSTSASSPRVVYGSDDRRDVYQETNPAILTAARSVCAIIQASNLVDNGDDTYTIQTIPNAGLCPDEPFADQPLAAFKTGFMADSDLIATAGRWLPQLEASTVSISSLRVVYGFQMTSANNANVIIPAADVFTPTEIVAISGRDYAILRVDRSMETADRKPLAIRRLGKIPDNNQIGYIGYPAGAVASDDAGLPEKIAFGPRTRVATNSSIESFLSNLDSFSITGGAPVFNQDTLQVEGLVVTGDGDFYTDGGCIRTNEIPDAASFESVQRTVTIQSVFPDRNDIYFAHRVFRCGASAEIHVHDTNYEFETLPVTVTSALTGDSESIILSDPQVEFDWKGAINIAFVQDAPTTDNGTLEVLEGDTITVTYEDDFNEDAVAGTLTDQASIDCTSPNSQVVTFTSVSESQIMLTVSGDEPTSVTILGGATCETATMPLATSDLATDHAITISQLTPCTVNYLRVVSTDRAGNASTDENGGICFRLTTRSTKTLYSEDFVAAVGWFSIVPDENDPSSDQWGVRVYGDATSAPTVYSFESAPTFATYSYLLSPGLPAGAVLEFYHNFETEVSFDGCIAEISDDDGATWSDLGPLITEGGYNRRLVSSGVTDENPFVGRMAWSGDSPAGMTRVRADISSINPVAANQIRLRFIFATNGEIGALQDGWRIDDVRVFQLTDCATAWALY